MASYQLASLIREPHLLDLVDEEWAKDCLPDDEVPLPETVESPVEDEEGNSEKQDETEKWHELGLNTVQ